MMEEISLREWYTWFRGEWKQGEHIAVAGPTGCGKTTLIGYLLQIRDYVVIVAVKSHDDIIETFREKFDYRVVSRGRDIIPSLPLYPEERVILSLPASSLGKDQYQTLTIRKALNDLVRAKGWTIFLDDLGRITGKLNLQTEVTTLLSEGRSSYVSTVLAMTQAKSTSARVPTESFRQCQHTILFGYLDVTSQNTCADLAGITRRQMTELIPRLGRHNFLYVGYKARVLVRNEI
jgi:energy-coupling factor transporter ATP-binding protein EcfA2